MIITNNPNSNLVRKSNRTNEDSKSNKVVPLDITENEIDMSNAQLIQEIFNEGDSSDRFAKTSERVHYNDKSKYS